MSILVLFCADKSFSNACLVFCIVGQSKKICCSVSILFSLQIEQFCETGVFENNSLYVIFFWKGVLNLVCRFLKIVEKSVIAYVLALFILSCKGVCNVRVISLYVSLVFFVL